MQLRLVIHPDFYLENRKSRFDYLPIEPIFQCENSVSYNILFEDLAELRKRLKEFLFFKEDCRTLFLTNQKNKDFLQ